MRVGWVLAVILFFVGSACFTPRSHPELSFVRTYDAPVDRLLLIYTFTAEMSVYSLVDILRALPETDVVVICQFAPASAEFEAFVRILNSDSLGFRADGRPRLQFLQNASSVGPWPRDQMLVEEDGSVWISRRDQHGLRPIFFPCRWIMVWRCGAAMSILSAPIFCRPATTRFSWLIMARSPGALYRRSHDSFAAA
jgi:hypothetical protein